MGYLLALVATSDFTGGVKAVRPENGGYGISHVLGSVEACCFIYWWYEDTLSK
jgi:hypothetical protein